MNEGGADTLVPFSAGGIVIESIAVTTMPNRTAYAVGDSFESTGMVITATLEDGKTINVTSMCTFEPSTFNTLGTITVTADCYGYTTSFNITCTAIYDTVKNATSVTEAQWLEFVNSGGIKRARTRNETSSFINKKVTLSNTADSSYTTWVIADFNHDYSGNTCDLILNNTIHATKFSSSKSSGQIYASSTARSWLTGTYYNGFSTDIKKKLKTMSVASNGSTLSDKVKLLSVDEVGISSTHNYYDFSVREGNKYPIFTAGGTGDTQTNSTRSYTGAVAAWWLRSRDLYDIDSIWYVGSTGFLYFWGYNNSPALLPCIRF